MLNHIIKTTKEFLCEMPKSKRKKKGQFFTSEKTAKFMAKMFDISKLNGDIQILDPGAGTGILSCALIERLFDYENEIYKSSKSEHVNLDRIILTCYETDEDVIPVLRGNMEYIKEVLGERFSFRIVTEDYILSQSNDFNGNLLANSNAPKYDLIIGNPPYLRIMRDDKVAKAVPKIVHGAPNLYFIFAAMSLFNLKPESEMTYIIPRSWTSGAYFKAFREYLFANGKIKQMHLFVSRDKVFNEEEVLQETMIIRIEKTQRKLKSILITSSKGSNDFDKISSITVPYNSVVSGEDLYVYLPTCDRDIAVIQKINTYEKTLPDEGLKMKTGIVVDFRQWDDLRKEPGEHILPLFYSQHIKNGRVDHMPSGKEYDWIVDEKPSLIQKNKNYVFCKRFTAKEERRRLQCGVYSPSDFSEYKYIGTQNKINFVDKIDGSEMDRETTYGVYALLNTTLFDMYYRILNGSTQVNSTEINNIPIPPLDLIKHIGERLMQSNDLSTDNCDRIVLEEAYG